MVGTCTQHVCHMYTAWASHVHSMGVVCALHVCHMYQVCSVGLGLHGCFDTVYLFFFNFNLFVFISQYTKN